MEVRRITNLPTHVFTIIDQFTGQGRREGNGIVDLDLDLGLGSPDPYTHTVSVEFCSRLVIEAKAATSPSVGFGPGSERHVRHTFIENE
jgi:hypothetical protein